MSRTLSVVSGRKGRYFPRLFYQELNKTQCLETFYNEFRHPVEDFFMSIYVYTFQNVSYSPLRNLWRHRSTT